MHTKLVRLYEDRMCVSTSACKSKMVMNNFPPILSTFALDMLIQMLDKSHRQGLKNNSEKENTEEKRQNDTEVLNCLKFA